MEKTTESPSGQDVYEPTLSEKYDTSLSIHRDTLKFRGLGPLLLIRVKKSKLLVSGLVGTSEIQ